MELHSVVALNFGTLDLALVAAFGSDNLHWSVEVAMVVLHYVLVADFGALGLAADYGALGLVADFGTLGLAADFGTLGLAEDFGTLG